MSHWSKIATKLLVSCSRIVAENGHSADTYKPIGMTCEHS